ncbi:MAG: amidase domain-containing protein [Clostridia bacterium]|nr:amidase domain-containing protein [Clostridia bacterium]
MLSEFPYNRLAVKQYATKWSLSRNPAYYNFDNIGGDCSNFASQCIYAGSKVMNYTPVMGWYYHNLANRSPSWTDVRFLYNFLVNNKSVGPYGILVDKNDIEVGDIIQLGNEAGQYYHTTVVMSVDDEILVAAHTFNALNRPLSSYYYENIRYIHILGVREFI